LYEMEINGRRIGNQRLAPGWTDYRRRVAFQTYDVTRSLRKGDNVVGAILGDGWYSGHVAERDRGQYGDRPHLLLRLEIVLADGSECVIETDDSWRTSTGPILENDLLMGESYDARRELTGWSESAFDDSDWRAVQCSQHPDILVEPILAPPVRSHEVLTGKEISRESAHDPIARRIFDLGQNIAGCVRLKVRGPAGTNLRIRHGEILDASGGLYIENLRSARATDNYTLKGDAAGETFEPRFTFHGFRYFEITWLDAKARQVEILKAEGVVLHSDTPRTGWFACSHPLLNQLASNILWGQKGNFIEVPTDCPQRDERVGWTGDAQVFIRTAAFFMNVQSFFRKWLRDLRDSQSANGVIPPFAPNTHSFGGIEDGGAAWADAICICPWTLYRCYGDLEVLRENYDAMVRYMRYLAENKVKDHIRAHPEKDPWGGFGDWLALEGDDVYGGTRKDLIGTAFYANNARIIAEAATVIGKDRESKHWQALHRSIVSAFQRRFLTEEGLLVNETQTACVLALHFDLLPKNRCNQVAAVLARKIKQRGNHLATGFVGTPYLLHVLERFGYLDLAYELLEQRAYPSWLYPITQGATTIWERWDGWTREKGFQDKGMNSFNHYAYGAVGDWMVSTVAGLEIAEPGYKKILFKPRPGGTLTSASARLLTGHGEASIAWELSEHTLRLALTVPAGSTAELSLPSGWKSPKTRLGPGTHRLTASREHRKGRRIHSLQGADRLGDKNTADNRS
jgi:alpha-L-rhamnosidase